MKEGAFVHSPNFYLRFLDKNGSPSSPQVVLPSLFGFVVPVKVKKTSVGRHLVKRKMSAVVENALLDTKPGLSVIIFAKNDVSKLSYSEIEKEILELLRKAGILIWKLEEYKVYSPNDWRYL